MPQSQALSPFSDRPRGTGRRERRRQEARDRIYNAAIELFLEQGYERTTMDEIGNRADVARTTVFNYYPKKSAFLDEWAARRRAKVADSLRQHHLDDKPIGVVLENYMLLFAQLNEEHRTQATELMPAAITFGNVLNDPPLAETVADYIRLAQERGQVWAEVDAGQAGLMLAYDLLCDTDELVCPRAAKLRPRRGPHQRRPADAARPRSGPGLSSRRRECAHLRAREPGQESHRRSAPVSNPNPRPPSTNGQALSADSIHARDADCQDALNLARQCAIQFLSGPRHPARCRHSPSVPHLIGDLPMRGVSD